MIREFVTQWWEGKRAAPVVFVQWMDFSSDLRRWQDPLAPQQVHDAITAFETIGKRLCPFSIDVSDGDFSIDRLTELGGEGIVWWKEWNEMRFSVEVTAMLAKMLTAP